MFAFSSFPLSTDITIPCAAAQLYEYRPRRILTEKVASLCLFAAELL